MIILDGKYASAKVFSDKVEPQAQAQIIQLLNQPFVKGSKIRVMPDVHKGAGCVIGFTAELTNMVIPNLVGVDINCGMFVVDITGIYLDMEAIDHFIHQYIPAGHNIHDEIVCNYADISKLRCYKELRNQYVFPRSIGTLGGGNHFIEIDVSANTGKVYLVVHTGSRNMGKQVAEYYQKVAVSLWKNGGVDYKEQREKIVSGLKAEKRGRDIPGALAAYDKRYKNAHPQYPADLCFLFDSTMQDYLHDMAICQEYARLNRETIATLILNFLDTDLSEHEYFETVHNYIDLKNNIMRKGAVSAQKGEKLIIPINMRDGALICIGKGNPDWNFSAPHGAGRLMSRTQAKNELEMPAYEMAMDGIYTTCVNPRTIDESPMAYKPIDEIIANIQDTVDIVEQIRPIYSFKEGEED